MFWKKRVMYEEVRVTVALPNGTEVTHKATGYEISPSGRLYLKKNDVGVAVYTAGAWDSFCIGHRAVRRSL